MEVKVEDEVDLRACRICLAWDMRMYNIRECGLQQSFTELMGLPVSASDGLPQHLCSWCRVLLLKARTLRERSRRTEALLRRALTNQKVITNAYIHSIDRSAHRLTHTLSHNLNTSIQDYHGQDTQTNKSDGCSDVKDEVETDENGITDGSIYLLQVDVKDNEINVFDINGDVGDSDDSSADDETKMNLQEYKCKLKMENVEAKPALAEVKIDTSIDKKKKISSKRKRHTTQQRKQLTRKCTKQQQNTRHKMQKLQDSKTGDPKVDKNRKRKKEAENKVNSETGRFITIEEIEQFVKKYNFEIQYLTEEEMVQDMERRKVSERYKHCKYKCNLCYKGFLTSTTFDNHMKKDHDPRNAWNECRLCRVSYRYGFYLRQHMQNAHRLRLRCGECGEGVWGRKECVEHAARHANATRQCKYCGKHFLKKSSYTWHMRAAHPVENAARGSCELCGEIYTSAKGLRAHKLLVHYKRSSPELQCLRCRTLFDNKEALRKHLDQQLDDKCDLNLSACAACGASCASAEALLQHMNAAHRVDIFTCDLCNKSFLSKSSLSTHIDRVHLGIRPLQHHQLIQQRVHKRPGKRQHDHMCEQCGKAYTTHQFLKNHQMTHTGERPFKCDRCPKGFTTATQLTWHTRSHTGERPYQCDQCHQAFSLEGNLQRHRKAVHLGLRKNVPCPRCEKTFSANSAMKLHVRTVHDGAPWPRRDRRRKERLKP